MKVRSWALAASLALTALSAAAQQYPVRPIKLVVGFPPGTATDIVARQVAERLAADAGWTVVVEN